MTDIDKWTNEIHTGDAFDVVEQLPANSIHACVTDPPYGLAFMGRDWDDFEPREYQEWCEEWAREVKRVMKPGGHLLAFSGNRTHHRLFTGVEDAGFEVRDTVTWHYGSGFPKASDISKTIDKRADAEREVTGKREYAGGHVQNSNELDRPIGTFQMTDGDERLETAPETDAAREWDGWKTGLKPATEYVVMARKPFEGATVDCVLEHGTGALNIDECRIGTETRENPDQGTADGVDYGTKVFEGGEVEGRYPSNVAFDQPEADRLDRQVGDTSSGGGQSRDGDVTESARYTDDGGTDFAAKPGRRRGDSGGPSRYFYTSKASKAERTLDGRIENAHPTVKPVDLMEWLIKLVTREQQIVLDPFAGSGTTCKAAKELNRRFIGVEQQAKYADVARVRVGLTPEDPSVVREDAEQSGIEDW